MKIDPAITFQQIVDFITGILAKIFGFIADSEGWTDAPEEITAE